MMIKWIFVMDKKWCPGPDLNRHVITDEGF